MEDNWFDCLTKLEKEFKEGIKEYRREEEKFNKEFRKIKESLDNQNYIDVGLMIAIFLYSELEIEDYFFNLMDVKPSEEKEKILELSERIIDKIIRAILISS